MGYKQIHARLDNVLSERLDEYAKYTGQTIQDCVVFALKNLLEKPIKKNGDFTFIDLFAGIGGMRIAFETAGGQCVYSNEWNKYCQHTYFANFGEAPDGDITKVEAESIPDHDILVAGFPCQPFSIAGVSKKNSLGRATGFEDKTQGTLFFDVCRILKAKRPMMRIDNKDVLVKFGKMPPNGKYQERSIMRRREFLGVSVNLSKNWIMKSFIR